MSTDGFGNRLPDSTDAVLRPSFTSLNKDIEARAIEQMHSSLDASVERAAREHEQPQLAFSDAEPTPAAPIFLARANAAEQLKIQAEIDRLRASAPQKPETETLAKMTFVPLNPATRDLQAENEEALRKTKEALMREGVVSPPRPVRVDDPKTSDENLKRQQFGFVGSDEAQSRRERVVPAYPQPQTSKTTGGADWSDWVT